MNRIHKLRIGFLLVVVRLSWHSIARGGSIIVPLDDVEKGDGTAVPVLAGEATIQSVYASSLLTDLPYGSQITGLAWRAARNQESFPDPARTWFSFDIQLSKSTFQPGNLSEFYADNIASDVVTVRGGPLTIPAYSFPGGEGGPHPFGFEIPFTVPYKYTGGDLLITVRHTDILIDDTYTDPGEIDFYFVDAREPEPGLYQSIGADPEHEDSYDGPKAGDNYTNTPLVQLRFTSAPEPSAFTLMAAALVGVALRPRRQRFLATSPA